MTPDKSDPNPDRDAGESDQHQPTCLRCGSTDGLETYGGTHLCATCDPGRQADESADEQPTRTGLWDSDVDFSETGEHLPDGMFEREKWLVATDEQKRGRAPWVTGENDEGDKLEYKWGREANWRSGSDVEMVLEDPRFDYPVFIQSPDDPYAHIDGDDVRDPETGEVHPAFIEILDQVGPTFLEVSSSGRGIHAVYKGELPEDVKESSWQLGPDPVAGADDPPSVEFYHRKRNLVMTGDHVSGSPETVAAWDHETVEELVFENDDSLLSEEEKEEAEERIEVSTNREDYDLEGYEPDVTSANEVTRDIRDVFSALERIDARNVAADTIVREWNDDASTSGENRAFDPVWGGKGNGTANIVNREVWQDTGDQAGYGTPAVMAAIDAGVMDEKRANPRRLTGEDWWEAVDHLRNLGYSIPEYSHPDSDGESEPLSMVPNEALTSMDHDERRRFARRRGVEWPSVDEVRDRLEDTILETVENGETAVIDSPTGSGKTHGSVTKPWLRMADVTDGQPVIHAAKTRDARDEAAQMAREEDLEVYKLRGRKETCPVAAGDYDPPRDDGGLTITLDGKPISEWIDHLCDHLGLAYSYVHDWMEQEVPHELPCEHDGPCESKSIFEPIPRTEGGEPTHDIICCTHEFLHVPSLRMHTNIFVDEKPDFTSGIDPETFRRSVNAYLSWADAPVDNFTELKIASQAGCEPEHIGKQQVEGVVLSEYKKGFADRMEDVLRQDPPISWYRKVGGVHALAPAFARAVWQAEEVADGRHSATVRYDPPRLDGDVNESDAWNRERVTVVFDHDFEVNTIWSSPDFTLANSVVGLDATANLGRTTWMQNIHPDIQIKRVLDPTERSLYRRYERGLFTVQIGDNMNPVTRRKYIEGSIGRKSEAVVNHLRDEYGEDFSTFITSAQARPTVRKQLEERGCEDPGAMHYGAEEGLNDFAGEDVGYVLGAIDPGDNAVMDLIAALGMDAAPERVDPEEMDEPAECDTCEGSGCTDCSGTGLKRAHGRGFTGEDADKAESVLREVTHHHVVQSAGRYARDADDPDDSAVVFIHTDRVPERFVDAEVPDVAWVANDEQRDRLRYIRENDGATAKDIAEATGCHKTTALRTMQEAAERGLVEVRKGAGYNGANIYEPSESFNPAGDVSIEADQIPTDADHVTGIYTATAAIRSAVAVDLHGNGDDRGISGEQTALTRGGPPGETLSPGADPG